MQFLKIGNDALIFDLPLGSLDDAAYARAMAFLQDTRVSAPVPPGRKGIYQRDFSGDARGIEEASGFAVAVFDQVLQLPGTAALDVAFGSP